MQLLVLASLAIMILIAAPAVTADEACKAECCSRDEVHII